MPNTHVEKLQATLKAIRREEDKGNRAFRPPLVCYALAEDILSKEEYEAMSDIDLSDKDFLDEHRDFALALAVLWIRRYYESSNGKNFWRQLLPAQRKGKCQHWNWESFLHQNRWKIIGARLNDTLLPKRGNHDHGAWIRSQCWVLKSKEAGHNSLTIKNNKALFELFKEYPECKDWDFATLLENCEDKLQCEDYLEWLWKDKGRREVYLQSLRVIAGYGEEPMANSWLHSIWRIAPDQIRAVWKLYINGQACSLRLYVSLPETARRATLRVGGVPFAGKRWISAEDLAKAGVDISHKFRVEADNCKFQSVKPIPEPAVFCMKKLVGGMAVLTAFDEHAPLPRRWQLAILHPRGVNGGPPSPCPEVYLCSETGEQEKLETKPLLQNDAYAVSLVSHTQKGRCELIGKTLQIGNRKYRLIFTPGIALGDTYEQELRTDGESASTYYIRTDKVEIINDDLEFAPMPEGLEVAILPEGRFLRLCPTAPCYGKGFTVSYSEKGAPNGRSCRFFFLEEDWLSKAQYIDMQGAPLHLEDAGLHGRKVAEILPVYTGRKPKIRYKYGEEVFCGPLPAALPYWHHNNHGTEEDSFCVRDKVTDLYSVDREWDLRIVFLGGEDGGDARIRIEKEGREPICISAVDFIAQPERFLNVNVEGGCLFRLYCESGGKRFLFFEGQQVENPVWEEKGDGSECIDPADGLTDGETALLTHFQVVSAAGKTEIRFSYCKNLTPEMLGYGDLPPVEEETDAEPLADWAQREDVALCPYLAHLPDATAEIKHTIYAGGYGFRLDFQLKNGIALPKDLAVMLRTALRFQPDGFVRVASNGKRVILHWDGAHLESLCLEQLRQRSGCRILYDALSGMYPQLQDLCYRHEKGISLDLKAFRAAGGRLRKSLTSNANVLYTMVNQPWLADWCNSGDEQAKTVFFLLLWCILKRRLSGYGTGYVLLECKMGRILLRWSGRDFTDGAPAPFTERWADVLSICPVRHRHLLPWLFSKHINCFPEMEGELNHYFQPTDIKP